VFTLLKNYGSPAFLKKGAGGGHLIMPKKREVMPFFSILKPSIRLIGPYFCLRLVK
jgi:hypothetical protein